jgi:hypothetical protein
VWLLHIHHGRLPGGQTIATEDAIAPVRRLLPLLQFDLRRAVVAPFAVWLEVRVTQTMLSKS